MYYDLSKKIILYYIVLILALVAITTIHFIWVKLYCFSREWPLFHFFKNTKTEIDQNINTVFDFVGREINPNKLGIVSYRGSEDKKPFMVGFFSSQELVYPQRTQTALRRRRELYSYREEQEKYTDYNLSRKSRL